jgi:2-polyprenyl-6-methoxyphenol hydroxylase-like FAD-dependent oxidoreductase
MAFLGRRELLQILYQSLPEKSNVFVDSTVVRVDYQEDNSVLVYTHDGRYYQGDLVVGADGVHSRVRAQMWRIGNALRPGMVTDDEKKGKCSREQQRKARSIFALCLQSYACNLGIQKMLTTIRTS